MFFKSKWIYYITGDYKTADDKYGNPSPYFRQTFSLKGNVKNATVFASALGVFKIFMNGSAVGDDYLSPGWVNYRKRLPFVRYDVTNMLKNNNAIGAVLGDGWAVGHLGSNYAFKRNGYSDRIEFTALLRIEYDDGTIEEISTDETWRASSGAILRSDIYMGEYIDNRLNLGEFSTFDYDDSNWDLAKESVFKFTRNLYLDEVVIPPIVVKHTFKPKLLRKKENAYLYDVSQNISGVLRCVFKGEKGAKVVLRHGEILSNGELYTKNLRGAESIDTYVLSGEGEEVFRPLFTFHGFQFAELTVTGNVEIVDIIAEAMYTDLESSGSFSCSDDIVNKVYQNALWGQRDNFLNVPTDCPQRDERLGWTGDAQIFCQSAMFNMDCRKFFEKYLADIRDEQLGNGVIPVVAPVPPVGTYAYTGHEAEPGWSEAIGEIPYTHYKMYGDIKIVRDNLPALKKLIDYYEKGCQGYIRGAVGKYGDWLSLGSTTDFSVIATMYYARAAYLAAKLCAVIGDFEKEYYENLYLSIKNAFCGKFVDKEGRILSDTQSAYAIAYSFGLIDKEIAKKHLVRKFEEDDGKLTTGFLGVKFLLPTLCDIGSSDIAYRLITNTDFPGWGYSVVNGATTIWERWDSYTKKDGIKEGTAFGMKEGMNSFNHYSLGSCTEWMYSYCLGIRPSFDKPGCKKVVFAPYLDTSGKITFANGHYDTDYGRITVHWNKTENGYVYEVALPLEIECEFNFDGMSVIKSDNKNGKYYFELIEK